MKKILILYTELAGYFVTCINHLASKYNTHIELVAYPKANEAPFEFEFHENIRVHDRSAHDLSTLQSLLETTEPDLLYCAGWSDKDYIRIATRNRIVNSLLGFDNQWNGSPKQQLATVYAKWRFAPVFNYAFVPGQPQKRFALRMGFDESRIQMGAYSCDLELFNGFYSKYHQTKTQSWPKRILYTGRYIHHKGIFDLFEAFVDLVESEFSDWELHCLGTGEMWDDRVEHPKIHHHGFIQPSDFEKHVGQCGIFVLPSHFEPWGVVAHEFAAAGFPLLLSDKIGAGSQFLQEGINGFSFLAGDKTDLTAKLKLLMGSDDSSLLEMASASHSIAQSISPDTWSKAILEMT
ncbi:MAG: glycosyltransferase [Flavobacteriales bacterium]|nr:glycosyltransferase [Flavobacteriales bacterium]